MTEKINLKMGHPEMKYFKSSVLLLVILTAACNVQNTRPDFRAQTDVAELQQLANIAYDNEVWEDVIQYYKQLTRKLPNDAESWYRIGNAYTQLNQTEFAVNAYQTALAIDPDNGKILHNLGVVQLQESTKTFIELKKHTHPDDPLNIRAQLVINAIATLLNKEFRIEIEN